ncbi:DUF4304 domain-containing protein [Limibacter armeniacum]|uniref:DUF4304 domain-containing protein n=1 Tax=Limibacter armeniacum TaxID=466084 RepID=UPI002FE587A2
MDAAEFKKLVAKHFSPRIREHGWKGSGFHFRKNQDNHVVEIFGLQGSWFGGSVCCETAIHFDFIPDLAGKSFNKATYASCIIRERLSPKGEGDHHWTFRDNEEDNVNSINQIWDAFEIYGQRFYKDFNNFPEPFLSIAPEDFDQTSFLEFGKKKRVKILDKYYVHNEIHLTWLLKEINSFIGKSDLAIKFGELGMKMTYDHANEMAKSTKGKVDQAYVDKNKELFKMK